ncbi:hypothetical protein [Nocardioides sp. SR21]|uniref:hypothetical protein n=1 Tax=Nocardioides sp. SR21 TaxID=2919501 RepID=UPI001FA98BF4|nr:hypothetical protein [Nocardioides sp. SR21]
MLTVRAAITAVLLTAVLALASPASAGGPTSAILSVPGEGRTASLYYTDAAYEQLSGLVGATGVPPGTVDDSGATHETGTPVTVTWLIHDVQPWRVDRIYLNADGGPWIATQQMDVESGEIWDSPVVWHQPTSGKELALLLDQLGVGQDARAAGDSDGVAEAPAPAAAEPPAAEPAPASTESGHAVWWGVGGLAAGVLLTLGWLRLRTAREDEPELDPGADWLAPQTRSTSA